MDERKPAKRKPPSTTRKRWYVVMFIPDVGERWVSRVLASSIPEALTAACHAYEAGKPKLPANLHGILVSCVRGNHA